MNNTTEIPLYFLNNCGRLIQDGLECLSAPGLVDIVQYNLPTIIGFIGAAISGKISIAGYWPNMYQCKIGATSSGKSETSDALSFAVSEVAPQLLGPSRFSAGTAFISFLADKNSKILCCFDEIGWMFRGGGNVGQEGASGQSGDKDRKETVTELYTRAGQRRYEKWYTNEKDRREIIYPCLSLLGNTTPDMLKDLTEHDFRTGFLPRWMFYRYDGEIPYRGYSISGRSHADLKGFAEKIGELSKTPVPGVTDIAAHIGDHPAYALGMTDDALEYMRQKANSIIDVVNSNRSEAESGIISRSFEHLHKLMLVVAASKRGLTGRLYDDITLADVLCAESLSDALAQWKMSSMLNNLSVGQFHDNTVVFLEAIDMAVKHGQNPTFGVLKSKKREIKNWPKHQVDSIISSLLASEEIEEVRNGRKVAYFRCK